MMAFRFVNARGKASRWAPDFPVIQLDSVDNPSGKLSELRRLTSVGAIVLVLSLSVAGCTDDPGVSAPTSTGSAPAGAAEALDVYMSALQAGDSAKLLAMGNPRSDAKPAIKAKIDKVGNRKWTHITVVWPEVIAATVPVADITATGPQGESISDHVILARYEGRYDGQWMISLGDPLTSSGPAAATELPSGG